MVAQGGETVGIVPAVMAGDWGVLMDARIVSLLAEIQAGTSVLAS
jgi:hypothetical protein